VAFDELEAAKKIESLKRISEESVLESE